MGTSNDPAVVKQVDYLAYFDRENAAVWFPFGPTLRSMLRDFKFFQRPRQNASRASRGSPSTACRSARGCCRGSPSTS